MTMPDADAFDADAAPLLALRDLAVARDGAVLLRGLDLELEHGDFVAVLGPSGSGKSTLLLAIAGLIDPAAGAVLLDGKSPQDWGYPAFRRRVVYVPQKPALLDTTVRVNLERVFSYRSAVEARFDSAEAEAMLERFHLPRTYLDKQAHDLSVGEQQRICLIRSLLIEPRVLLLDEPTSALDVENREFAEQLLREAAREHDVAALVVTHDRQQAERLCSRIVEMEAYRAAVDRAFEGAAT
jgi:putative ABC transport system ATP-binding protein